MMFEPSEDQQPVMYLRGYPLHAAHFIVLLFVITMVVCTLAGTAGVSALTALFGFSSELVHHGQVWRIFTYGLVNPPTLGFVIDMLMIVWFGRELEKFFGRRVFLRFYAILYVLTPLTLTALGFFRPMSLVGETGGFALFIAFATLYPNAAMLFNLLAKWVALVLVAIFTLNHLYARDFVGLTALWVGIVFAFAFVRHQQGALELPTVRLPSMRKRPKLRVLPDPEPSSRRDEDDAPMAEVDALLDKIAKHGIASLSTSERARLEKAREDLMKRESPRR